MSVDPEEMAREIEADWRHRNEPDVYDENGVEIAGKEGTVGLFSAEVDVVTEEVTLADWIAEGMDYGITTTVLAERGAGGGWPDVRVTGERDAVVKFLCERWLGGGSVERDLADAGVEIVEVA